MGDISQRDTVSRVRKTVASDDTRVRDHCHLTGRYKGPAHSNCNLNFKDLHCISVVFYNLSGYDVYFIINSEFGWTRSVRTGAH